MINNIWYEKYKPTSLDQCFLPVLTKKTFKKFIKIGELPNLIFSGPPGIGKTTSAELLIDALGADKLKINASLKGNIDTLRTEITQFASTISFTGGKKYIILDEADNITNATQTALRGFIDEFSTNCGFIFTCNYREKIIDPIADSRLVEVSFTLNKEESSEVAKQLFDRLQYILVQENVTFDPQDVKRLIIHSVKQNTDFRKIINTLQKGVDDGNVFVFERAIQSVDSRVDQLISLIQQKEFEPIRMWVAVNADLDPVTLIRSLYDYKDKYIKSHNIWVLVCIVSKYMHQHSTAIDPEINLMGCISEIVRECL